MHRTLSKDGLCAGPLPGVSQTMFHLPGWADQSSHPHIQTAFECSQLRSSAGCASAGRYLTLYWGHWMREQRWPQPIERSHGSWRILAQLTHLLHAEFTQGYLVTLQDHCANDQQQGDGHEPCDRRRPLTEPWSPLEWRHSITHG
jgi:hypothetical protein